MIINYLKVAFRSIVKQKIHSVINVLGLAIGIAATLLIILFLNYELSFDQYHENSDRIYRTSRQWFNNEKESVLHLGHVAPPFGPHLKAEFTEEIEEVVRLRSGYSPLMESNDKKFEEEGFFFADNGLLNVFSWNLVEGNRETALKKPFSIILSESAAIRYFNNKDVVGKTITFNSGGNKQEMEITGIIENTPPNSHFKYTMLASFSSLESVIGRQNLMQNFGSNNYSTYLMLKEGFSIDQIKSRVPDLIDKYMQPGNDGSPASKNTTLNFMPLTDIHLHSHLDSEIEANGNINFIYTYGIIAMFILLIASINFMNLSTARSLKRAKEVGVRKVAGANRTSLINQFLMESLLTAFIGAILAMGLIVTSLPWFNEFANTELSLETINLSFVFVILFVIIIIVGVLAGSYPAFVLSSFRPIKVLKGEKLGSHKKINLRSVLVVFQFFISICLLIGVGVINDQLEYMKTKNLGFQKENLLVLPLSDKIYNDFELIKKRLQLRNDIVDVSLSSRVPSGRLLDSQGGQYEVKGDMQQLNFRLADIHVDHDYLNTLNVKFIAGRNFNKDQASDSSEAFIINRSAIKSMGYNSPEQAIDKKLIYGNRTGYIIGVVEDFHFESLHQSISPIVFMVTSGRANSVLIKFKGTNNEELISYLKNEWNFLRPDYPFDFYTLDERLNEQYISEEKLSTIVKYFSLLAIFIAILGLFGLASYNIEQSVKEIGIRKVMGASVANVFIMFTRRFVILVLIGNLIAIPVCIYGMSNWLSNFPYTTSLKPVTFIVGSIIALIFAIAIISIETVKAARTNPANTLRT